MEELLLHNDQYYILATAAQADRPRVLKHGDTFALLDRRGDIQPVGLGEQGLYHEGTRFLSQFELRLGRSKPLLLSSTVKEDNSSFTIDLTNPDIQFDGDRVIPRGSLHIVRSLFLWRAACYERLKIKNYAPIAVRVNLTSRLEADFADIFEIRGTKRPKRGRRRVGRRDQNSLVLEYEGLDGVLRRLRLECTPEPVEILPASIVLGAVLEPQQEAVFFLTATCEAPAAELGVTPASPRVYDTAFAEAARALAHATSNHCEIYSSNEQFNDWVNRSRADLQMLVTDTEQGLYPDAGVPWFCTRFGRDGIITALESLWWNPEMTAGVLSYLAASQACDVNAERDAEPGKILHETRKGEMAELNEIPFRCYYGSVDSTPLFVLLAAAYYERTGDLAFLQRLWPSVELALYWIDRYGDSDQDGFVEYFRHSASGLVQQGWKDSSGSVFHKDGSLAEGAIALCEVQGYVYAAKLAAARLAAVLGEQDTSQRLTHEAKALQEKFEQVFWCEELGTYALALDGDKRACQVCTSNAGHALFSGICSPERGRRVGQSLLDSDCFSGWGIRTVAASEKNYNPMSYHNGSVWPHDNALIAFGLARYGFKEMVDRIVTGLFETTQFVEFHRLPELLCGFPRRPDEAPTLYPVACSPQAWAAGSIFLLIQALLGLSIDAPHHQIRFTSPHLPNFLQWIRIQNLRVGSAAVDLSFHRYESGDVAINLIRKTGDIQIISTK